MSLLHLWHPPRVTVTNARVVKGVDINGEPLKPRPKPKVQGSGRKACYSPEAWERKLARNEQWRRENYQKVLEINREYKRRKRQEART